MVQHKRGKLGSVEKEVTWVASHLCHNRLCVNTARLIWEPSWFNRLRDNYSGVQLVLS